MDQTALVTGSSGLIGSELVDVPRRRAAGPSTASTTTCAATSSGEHGDTTSNLERLRAQTRHFDHHDLDIRDRCGDERSSREMLRPALIVHCAAQPSHDLAAQRPFDDFDVTRSAR